MITTKGHDMDRLRNTLADWLLALAELLRTGGRGEER